MDTKDLQGIDYLDTDSNTCLNFIWVYDLAGF